MAWVRYRTVSIVTASVLRAAFATQSALAAPRGGRRFPIRAGRSRRTVGAAPRAAALPRTISSSTSRPRRRLSCMISELTSCSRWRAKTERMASGEVRKHGPGRNLSARGHPATPAGTRCRSRSGSRPCAGSPGCTRLATRCLSSAGCSKSMRSSSRGSARCTAWMLSSSSRSAAVSCPKSYSRKPATIESTLRAASSGTESVPSSPRRPGTEELKEKGVVVRRVLDRRDRRRAGLDAAPPRRLRLYDQALGVGRGQAAKRVRHIEARQERGGRPAPADIVEPVRFAGGRHHRPHARAPGQQPVQPLHGARLGRSNRQQRFGFVAQQQQLDAAPGREAPKVRKQSQRVFFVGHGRRDAERVRRLRDCRAPPRPGPRPRSAYEAQPSRLQKSGAQPGLARGQELELAQQRRLAHPAIADNPVRPRAARRGASRSAPPGRSAPDRSRRPQ